MSIKYVTLEGQGVRKSVTVCDRGSKSRPVERGGEAGRNFRDPALMGAPSSVPY